MYVPNRLVILDEMDGFLDWRTFTWRSWFLLVPKLRLGTANKETLFRVWR